MKEKIFPILKNTFLVVFLVWIGLLLKDIKGSLRMQSNFIKTQILCAKTAAKLNYEYGKPSTPLYNEQRQSLANFAGIPKDSVGVFCRNIEKFSGSN